MSRSKKEEMSAIVSDIESEDEFDSDLDSSDDEYNVHEICMKGDLKGYCFIFYIIIIIVVMLVLFFIVVNCKCYFLTLL